jgi:ADP-ribosylglycohydrolase
MIMIKKPANLLICLFLFASYCPAQQKTLILSKETLKDKIMGGWAGQTIAVTFGGPYEFRFMGTFIQDYQPLAWYDGYLKKTMLDNPGLYDDLYMDLTFVDVFERLGLDAPVDSFAGAFAHAGYMLWHANQAARYNILNGIRPPLSGNWINNPHADDIDYQIESDFAGLMSPGMPNTASAISDKIGHIMNYGDGWYGGVFVGAMYTLAFTSNDIAHIVGGALKTIPPQSKFHQCIADVIKWHRAFPLDWHKTWFELQKKWSSDAGCPDGVFDAFDIDAKINAAYVVMGLLYGNGDYSRTLEIAARAGQDADCNPSTAGGVLGAMLGYKNIPAYWKMGLRDAEAIDFKYTTMSLDKVYETGFRQALENIRRNGGSIEDSQVRIRLQEPATVRLEQSFPGMIPILKQELAGQSIIEKSFDFKGTGFVLRGAAIKKIPNPGEYVFNLEVSVDGGLADTIRLPTLFTTRRHDLCWKYALPRGNHTVKIRVLNPADDFGVNTQDYIVYSDQPIKKK